MVTCRRGSRKAPPLILGMNSLEKAITPSIQFRKLDPLNTRVFQHLADDAAVAPADHEHRFGLRVGTEGGMHHGFVVVLFAFVRDLGDGIEKEDLAEFVGIEQRNGLVARPILGRHVLDRIKIPEIRVESLGIDAPSPGDPVKAA